MFFYKMLEIFNGLVCNLILIIICAVVLFDMECIHICIDGKLLCVIQYKDLKNKINYKYDLFIFDSIQLYSTAEI